MIVGRLGVIVGTRVEGVQKEEGGVASGGISGYRFMWMYEGIGSIFGLIGGDA